MSSASVGRTGCFWCSSTNCRRRTWKGWERGRTEGIELPRKRQSSGLCGVAHLQLLSVFEFALGIVAAAELSIGLAQQLVRHGIVGIHADGTLERPYRQFCLALFLQNFSHQNEWARRGGVQPNRALEQFLGFVELLRAQVGVTEFVIYSRVAGIDGELLFELRGCRRNFRLVEVQLAKQEVGHRQFGVERNGLLPVFLSNGTEVQSQEHAAAE